jgi:hypothetical protein
MGVWEDPSSGRPPILSLAAHVQLVVVQRTGDWALVRAENGWSGWVDGRRLVANQPAQYQPASRAAGVARPESRHRWLFWGNIGSVLLGLGGVAINGQMLVQPSVDTADKVSGAPVRLVLFGAYACLALWSLRDSGGFRHPAYDSKPTGYKAFYWFTAALGLYLSACIAIALAICAALGIATVAGVAVGGAAAVAVAAQEGENAHLRAVVRDGVRDGINDARGHY